VVCWFNVCEYNWDRKKIQIEEVKTAQDATIQEKTIRIKMPTWRERNKMPSRK
jgi:hypothetical protein